MNSYRQFRSSLAIYALGVIGSFLIVILLVWEMYRYTRPLPITQNRAAERKKALIDMRNAETESLNTYGWVDQTKGIVRLPVARAIELVLQESQNPAAARSNLVARAEKAAAVPPPPVNKYE